MSDEPERELGKIERGVPLPDKGAGRNAKWPWAEMEIGDSFLMHGDPKKHLMCRQQAYSAGKRLKRRYAVHQTAEGVRVWRVQ